MGVLLALPALPALLWSSKQTKLLFTGAELEINVSNGSRREASEDLRKIMEVSQNWTKGDEEYEGLMKLLSVKSSEEETREQLEKRILDALISSLRDSFKGCHHSNFLLMKKDPWMRFRNGKTYSTVCNAIIKVRVLFLSLNLYE